MNQTLKRFLKQLPGVDQLLRRIGGLENQVRHLQTQIDSLRAPTSSAPEAEDDPAVQNEAPPDYPVNVYEERIPWEIPVQLCLKDVIKRGDCVIDVGANIGGLSIAMSRLVGPRGQVHTFEANPSLLPRLKADLNANRAANVTVTNKAVWCNTGERLDLHLDDSYYAAGSSLVASHGKSRKVAVETIALDDYCRERQLAPAAVKIDVEGAEYAVLTGAEQIIRRYMPAIVFEYRAARTGDDPVAFLQSLGYVLYDTNNYRRVDREYYLSSFESAPMANVLAIPQAKAAAWSVAVSPPTRMEIEKTELRSRAFRLEEPGRYIVAVGLDGPETETARLSVVSADGTQLACYVGPISHLKQHGCSNLVFEVDGPTSVVCEIEADHLKGGILKRAEVSKVCVNLDEGAGRRGFEAA